MPLNPKEITREFLKISLVKNKQALEAHRRAGHKPQARMVARRVRPRLPDGRPRQGEGQAGLLPVLFGEEETREADKARLALGPPARKEWGRRVGASCLISQMRGVVNARVDKACISSMQIARFGTSLADAWVELDSAIKLAAVTKHARSILHCDRARLFISSLTGRLGYSD